MNNDSEIVIKPIKAFKDGDAGNPDMEPFADWATISQFEVRVNKRSKFTARVYANGYQQVPIEILIEARDSNGVVVNLSADQLRNIRLIDYDTAEPLGDMHYFHDPRFIYQWEPILGEGGDVDGDIHNGDELPESRAQSMTWYGKKFNVSASKVAAEITSPSGGVFRTNTPNAAPGKFDSWITVLGVEEPLYDHRDLEMERVDEVTNSIWDVDLYYIRFSNREFNIVDSAQLDGYPNVPHHSSLHPLIQSRYHISFKYGPQFTMKFDGVDGLPGVSFEVNKRPGQATVARCTVELLQYYHHYRGHACMWYFTSTAIEPAGAWEIRMSMISIWFFLVKVGTVESPREGFVSRRCPWQRCFFACVAQDRLRSILSLRTPHFGSGSYEAAGRCPW